MKNDQTGTESNAPRHIYANPLMPEICPILALGLYLVVNPDVVGGQIYPGNYLEGDLNERLTALRHKTRRTLQ